MKTLKKLLATVLAACILLTLAACSTSEDEMDTSGETETSETSEGGTYHIGFALDTYSNAINAEIARVLEEECANRGYQLTTTDAEGDASRQLANISSLRSPSTIISCAFGA